jgi:tRNA(fMet)-specific endonuclease VapC
MRRFLIDTNVYSHAQRGDDDVLRALQRMDEISVSSISIGELFAGFRRGRRDLENRQELARFLDAPRVSIFGIDVNTAGFYAEVLHALRQAGTPIPTNDIWIAAVSFQHGLPLYTLDQHFQLVPGLSLMPESL